MSTTPEQKLEFIQSIIKGWLIEADEVVDSMALAVYLQENLNNWTDGLVAHVSEMSIDEYINKKTEFYNNRKQQQEETTK